MRRSAVSTYWRPAADSCAPGKRLAARRRQQRLDRRAALVEQLGVDALLPGPALVHQRVVRPAQAADLGHVRRGIHDSGTGPPTAACAAAGHRRGRSWRASSGPATRRSRPDHPDARPRRGRQLLADIRRPVSPPARTPFPSGQCSASRAPQCLPGCRANRPQCTNPSSST